jgi:hypothetical protein
MNIEELEKWIATDEGVKWLETQKQGLANKNTELLEKLKTANGDLETANGTIQKLQSENAKTQAVNREALLTRPLAEKLKSRGVFDVLLPEISKTVIETYGLNITDGNAAGRVTESGKERVLTMDEAVDAWSKLETSKDYFKPRETQTVSTVPNLCGGISATAADKEWAAMRKGAKLPPEKE